MAEREEFFKYLNWLNCWFCEEVCSEKVPFHYLQCGGICCGHCLKRMTDLNVEKKVKCVHCKKSVCFVRIHPTMPEKFRGNFQNPEKYLNKYLENENSQSRIRQNYIDYMDSKIENVTKEGNKLRKAGIAIKKNVDEIINKRDQLVARLSSVIPVERIEQIVETMTLEEIEQMPYEQMVAGQRRPRRRDSVYQPSQRSLSNSTSSPSISRSSLNRGEPSSSTPLRAEFNNLRLGNNIPQQSIDVNRRRQSRDFDVAVDERHYENLGNAGAIAARISSRRQSRHQPCDYHQDFAGAASQPRRRESVDVRNARNVPNVSDPNARMAFNR